MKIPTKQEIRTYNNELEDDFNGKSINQIKIDKNYKYIHKNILWRIGAFIIYRVILLIPLSFYTKMKYKLKIVNKEVLKTAKDTGYFIYANHTQPFLDVCFPTFITFPKRVYVIASPKNISVKKYKMAVEMLGALPVPSDKDSTKNFLQAIKYHINKKRVISIYPEAHVWSYYTKIRNFGKAAFRYPVMFDVPAFCYTTTYQKTKNNHFKIVIYVDGPFYKDKDLNSKDAEQKMRDEIYNKMIERSKESNVEIIKYQHNED